MRWKGRAGRWVHTVWSEITVSSLYHLLAAIALPGSHSFNERIYSPWKNLFCVSLMCNIKKKKKKSPKYWLSEVIGIHVAAISYWQSHKKAEICQANPVCALLRGPHSSVAGHVDNNKKKKKELYLQKRTEVCCFSSDVQSQAGLSRGASWPAQWYRGVGALYLSVPACALQYKSPGPLYLPWQRGLFVLDDPSRWSWCGASNVVHYYRRKDCGRVVTICQQRKRCSVQGGKEERTSVVFAGLCVCVCACVRAGCRLDKVCWYCIQAAFPQCWHYISFICGVKKIRVEGLDPGSITKVCLSNKSLCSFFRACKILQSVWSLLRFVPVLSG